MRAVSLLYAWRLIRLALHVCHGLVLTALLFPHSSQARRMRIVQKWSAQLLAICNVRLRKQTGTAPHNGLLVANHTSWLDVVVINAVCPSRFVAKSEIRNWPLLGWLAARIGTLFIERGKRHSAARVNRAMIIVLERGECVTVFPEGTTTDGSHLKFFHASLLQAAISSGVPVQPLALTFRHADGRRCLETAYVGEMSLWQSLDRMLRQSVIYAELVFTPPLETTGAERCELAHRAESTIANALSLPAPHRKPAIPRHPSAVPPTGSHPIGSQYPAPPCFPAAPVQNTGKTSCA